MATLAEAAATSAERFVYFQLSSLHGFVEYDLRRDRVRRLVFLPLSATARGLPRQDYSLDSAHHGLAMNPRGTKLCAAGTTSNYAAIVRRRTMTQPAQPPTPRHPAHRCRMPRRTLPVRIRCGWSPTQM
jgi:hypothetical protein